MAIGKQVWVINRARDRGATAQASVFTYGSICCMQSSSWNRQWGGAVLTKCFQEMMGKCVGFVGDSQVRECNLTLSE